MDGVQDAAAPTDSTDRDSLLLIDSSWSICQWPDGGIQFLPSGGGFSVNPGSSVLEGSRVYHFQMMRVSTTVSAQKARAVHTVLVQFGNSTTANQEGV